MNYFNPYYRGTLPVMIGCIPAHGLYFSIYEFMKLKGKQENKDFSILTGLLTSFFHDLIMTPADTIKQ